MRKHRRLSIGLTTIFVAALGAVVLNTPVASADVAGSFATTNLGSDPHMIDCTDTSTGTNGFCLYTSQDMGQQYAYPGANYYPMRDTKAYFSPNGVSGWVDKGTVFTESTLDAWAGKRTDCVASGSSKVAKSPDVAPNCRAYHLWAPSAIKDGGTYWLFVPDVSDTRDTGTPNIHTSSRIAVSSSSNPFGPFTYQGTVDYSSGYMSDPDVAIDPITGIRYLLWADGDFGNCGGFKSAQMSSNWRTITPGTTQTVAVNGIPSQLGTCGSAGRPYFEGGSIYKNFAASSGFGGWTMFFALKPAAVPTDCDANNAPAGSAQSDYEVIAYATATSAQGPYTWGGIVMCGSTTEWTNQATVKSVYAGGTFKKMIVYHDSPAGKTRKLHAECLYYGSGHIAGVYRQAPNASYGFDDCMASTTSGTWLYKGLWGRDPQYPTKAPIMSTESGNSDIISKRYAVGPWERYKFELVSGNTYVIRALANGKLLCTPNSSTPIRPNCTSSTDTTAQFIRETPNPQVYSHFRLKAVSNNLYVNITSNGRLTPSGSAAADAALFAPLSPTGG